MTLPATDPTIAAFLRDSMVAHLVTVSASGRPFLTPLWFVADAGALYLTTGVETRAARNVAIHPEVAVLLWAEHGTRRDAVLRLRGTSTRHRGLPSWRVLLRVAAKYYLAPGGLAVELGNATKWGLRARYYAQVKGGAGHLRIVPTGGELLPRP